MPELDPRVAALRAEFDRAFAEPVRDPGLPPEKLLLLGASGVPYAAGVTTVSRIEPFVAPTPLPGAPDGLLGIAAREGHVLAVWHLGTLLGLPGRPDPRWLVIVESPAGSVALAAEEFGGVAMAPAVEAAAEAFEIAGVMRKRLDAGAVMKELSRTVESARRR